MTIDTRTDAERRYDALKDGTAYQKEDECITLAREADRLIEQINDDTIAVLEEIDGGETPPPATTPGVTLTKHEWDWYEYEAGTASIGIEEGKPSTMLAAGQMFEYLDRPERVGSFFNDLYTLLSDPAVQGYLNIKPAQIEVEAQYLYPDPEDEDDFTTVPNGALSHVRFERKDATLIIEANGEASYLGLGDSCICQLKALQALPDLVAILADPRVLALRAANG